MGVLEILFIIIIFIIIIIPNSAKVNTVTRREAGRWWLAAVAEWIIF